ncbi:MAG: HAD-IIA family hydrolase [Anaerolineae bacterium]
MTKDIAGIVFDIDGCLAKSKQALPGVPETLHQLRERGIRLTFFTNDNMRTADQWVERLAGMGIPAARNEVLNSGIVAAEVARDRYAGRRILAVGTDGLKATLRERGLNLLSIEEAEQAEVVIMGKDPDFDQHKLALVFKAIWGGAEFVATNLDPRVVTAGGLVPGTGCMIKAVAYATNKEPQVMGKPSSFAAEIALRRLGVPAEKAVVVGDQVEPDIKLGKVAGTRTILVLTGATDESQLADIPAEFQPDAVLPDVTHVLNWLDQ